MQYRGIVGKLTNELMDTGKTYLGKSARVLAKPAYAVLIAGGLLVSSGIEYHRDAEAQTPPSIVCCNGKTINVVAGNPLLNGDLQYVHDVVQGLINGSDDFRTYTSQSTKNTINVYVYRNNTQVLGGAVVFFQNSVTVAIDLADNEAIIDYLVGDDVNPLTNDDKTIIYFGKDKQTLVHEFGHLNLTQDPHTKENAVLNDVNAGWSRTYYGACNIDDMHTISGVSVGNHSGYIDITAFSAARNAVGGNWPSDMCSVGGIAELPEVSGLPKYTSQNKRDQDNTIPIAAGSALAGTAALATGWHFKKRREQKI